MRKALKPFSGAFEKREKRESRSVKSNRLLNKRNDGRRLNDLHDAKAHVIHCVVRHVPCIILKHVCKTYSYFIIFIPFAPYL